MKILFTAILSLAAAAAVAQTTINPVNIGTTPNDGTGDPVRTAFSKVNANEASLAAFKAETNSPSLQTPILISPFEYGGYAFSPFTITNPATGPANLSKASAQFSIKVSGSTVNLFFEGVTLNGVPTTTDVFSVDNFTTPGIIRMNTIKHLTSNEEMIHADGSVSLNNGATNSFKGFFVVRSTNSPPTIVTGTDGSLWNSNSVLYWVTATRTNLINDGR